MPCVPCGPVIPVTPGIPPGDILEAFIIVPLGRLLARLASTRLVPEIPVTTKYPPVCINTACPTCSQPWYAPDTTDTNVELFCVKVGVVLKESLPAGPVGPVLPIVPVAPIFPVAPAEPWLP